MSSSAAQPRSRPAAAFVISPIVDLLCVGGLSLIVFVPLLLSGRRDLVFIGAGAQAWLATAINMPHFMASYRIVYRDRAMIMRHKWASIYVPLILIAYIAAALWEAQTQASPVMVIVLVSVASAYLAWHYTGQVWGMMASYAYLDGVSFDKTEKLLVRTSLRILLAWQVTWFLYTTLKDPTRVESLYWVISTGTLVAFVLGAIGLIKMSRRTGRRPPLRALVAWVALFVWYAMLARDPRALFWIQIAHAIQYLAFPVRVEINRTKRSATRIAFHMVLYGAGILVVSVIVAQIVPKAAMGVLGDIFGDKPSNAAPVLILMFINIHHYFTDGVIWKISDPEVRQELFAHVPRPAKGPGVSATDAKLPAPRKPAKSKR